MDGCLNVRMLLNYFFHSRFIGNIRPLKQTPLCKFLPPGNQRIQYYRRMTGILKRRTDGAANVSCTTSDEIFHDISPNGWFFRLGLKRPAAAGLF